MFSKNMSGVKAQPLLYKLHETMSQKGTMMEILLGVTLYVAVIFGFVAFGRFLKECDSTMREQLKH